MNWSAVATAFSKSRLWASRILVIGYLVLYLVRGRHPLSLQGDGVWIAVAGIFIALTGAVVRSWAAGVIRKNQGLSTTGPYALARHPLYLGATLIACGFGLMVGDAWWWALVAIIALLIYVPTIRKEEAKMHKLYPREWEQYTRNVWIVCPKRIPRSGSWMKWSLAQWMKNREYNAFFTTICAVLVLCVWGWLAG